jgi:hypothetical protein
MTKRTTIRKMSATFKIGAPALLEIASQVLDREVKETEELDAASAIYLASLVGFKLRLV